MIRSFGSNDGLLVGPSLRSRIPVVPPSCISAREALRAFFGFGGPQVFKLKLAVTINSVDMSANQFFQAFWLDLRAFDTTD